MQRAKDKVQLIADTTESVFVDTLCPFSDTAFRELAWHVLASHKRKAGAKLRRRDLGRTDAPGLPDTN